MKSITAVTRLVLFGILLFALLIGAAGRSANAQAPSTHTLEIQYRSPEAGEVFLVWGVNGWNAPPEAGWPPNSVSKGGIVHTPMALNGDAFTIRLPLTNWTTINFGFLTTQTKDGSPVNAWEADGSKDYQVILGESDQTLEISSGLTREQLLASPPPAEPAKVFQDFRYAIQNVGEVYLVWGMNGWGLAPETDRPEGTVVENDVMRTPMQADGDAFTARVKVPAGSVLDYGFLVTKTSWGEQIEVWEADGDQDYHLAVEQDSVVEHQSHLALSSGFTLAGPWAYIAYALLGVVALFVIYFLFRRL